MKIAYLVLAHNTPNHLRRLISALSTPSSTFFIHLDQKSDMAPFAGLAADNVSFTRERVPVYWGDFSQVEAILVLLRTAFVDPRGFDRFVLLSGSDYPLRSAAAIERFFAERHDLEFIDMVAMPSADGQKPLSRLTTYQLPPGRTARSNKIRRFLSQVGGKLYFRNYKAVFRDLAPYGGSTWWAFSRAAASHVLAFTDREQALVRFFRNMVSPDEQYFQTILANSPFRSRIVRALTYALWTPGSPNPATLSVENLPFFASTSTFSDSSGLGAGEMLFARKFADDAADLIAQIDQQIRDKERRAAAASVPPG